MRKVEKAIGSARLKRASPISASLPNRKSAYFLSRMGALRSSPPQKRKEESNSIRTSTTTEKPVRASSILNSFFVNDGLRSCKRLTQSELVAELKHKGTYNPDLMAWDALGVIRFLDRSIHDHYQRQPVRSRQREDALSRNVDGLAKLLKELNVTCDLKSDYIVQRLNNSTFAEPRHSIISPSIRRSKRLDEVEQILRTLNSTNVSLNRLNDQPLILEDDGLSPKQKLVGESHIVPFGCDKRGAEEDGYLRLCGACQAIRHLPETFFPPFINEVTCDSDKACLYFYDYRSWCSKHLIDPVLEWNRKMLAQAKYGQFRQRKLDAHGKCRQKHMNFVVLRNVGSKECEVWQKFNLNVRVSCECFVGK
ncbi:unnamed protein product [Nippostrongylus brasiliensis]|uniref:GRF-type domain-containing protein n=1 Tax=Nippostrongylus brasiliensis TaxID=27835 RepID=A0A0N4XT24_NIPBR|nr:unnamed protein product [Nippostrongylus brasiliensis]